jgi:small-conductance mechanosensitive channel
MHNGSMQAMPSPGIFGSAFWMCSLDARSLLERGPMSRVPVVFWTFVAALVFAGAPAIAQDTTGGANGSLPAAIAEIPRAPVVIDGEQLFLVRGISSYPAEQRAEDIANRIRALAADRRVPVSSLTVDDQQGAAVLLAGTQRLMGVLDEDASLEQIDRASLAQAYLSRIRGAVEAYRQAREPAALGWNALYTLAATLVIFAAAYVGRRVVRRLQLNLEQRYETRVRDVQIQAFQIVKAEQIWKLLSGVLNLAWVAAVIVMIVGHLRYVLGLFPWTRGIGNSLIAILIDPLETLGLGLIGEVPNLAFLAVVIFLTRYLLKMVRLFFQAIDGGTVRLPEFDAEWAWPTYRLVRLLIIALAIIVAYPYIPGSQSDAFKGITVFLGIVFSLGSSSLIGNIIAGYSMTYRRAFKLGDRVKIGQYVGEVVRMRLLVTHLRTPKNEEVVVPNSTILGAEIVNYSSISRERGLILHTSVDIGYETPWRQVEAMLLEAAARTPGVRREPAPFVLQKKLGDFAVTYEINAFSGTPEAMLAHYSALHRNILDVFNEYGVQIMTPAYESDPVQPKLVPKDEWYAAPAQRPEHSSEPEAAKSYQKAGI